MTVAVEDANDVEVDAETLAMLEERVVEADRGELADGDEVIRRLREHLYAEVPAEARRSR